jgi:heme oxygenase-like protein
LATLLLADAAPGRASRFDNDDFQRGLARWNRSRLVPGFPDGDWPGAEARDVRMRRQEGEYLDSLRSAVIAEAAGAPTDPDGFLAWFEGLKDRGPGQDDPLFPWLADEADRDQMRWFLGQEAAGEAGFEDLLAYTQVRMPARAKLEFARNYWDEMGRGNRKGMHGPMLHDLALAMDVTPVATTTIWQSLALNNLMVALAANRRYAFQSVGALGVIELTAPGRAVQVNAGLRRLGVPGKARHYFELHAVLDIKHSASWNREVLASLVSELPHAASAIAEGALLRLAAGACCFERYRAHLGL